MANILRLLLGWFMLWDGISLLTNPDFSASGFLLHAKTFPEFYAWFATPANLWWVDPVNAWGITLIGAALLIGIAPRLASWAGAVLMILYYFPHVAFPYTAHGYIVEVHIIYAAVFVFVALTPAARTFGLSHFFPNRRKWKFLK